VPSVHRIRADDWEEPGWSTPRPWVAVTWVVAIAAVVGAAAYLGLRPDAWDLYQQDFGCTALTNIDSSYARSRCKPTAAADRAQLSANSTNTQRAGGRAKPLLLGGGR